MNPTIVKRNYLYFILLLLKRETSKNGTHLSAEDIASRFKKDYGLEPNRKTIYTAIADLQAIGFDIHLDKNRASLGYYLGDRPIREGELYLLIDGIESLDNVKSDDKRDIEEKLCEELGYDFNKIDSHLYEKWNEFNDHIDEGLVDDAFPSDYEEPSVAKKMGAIRQAINADKQLCIIDYMSIAPSAFTLVDMDEKDEKDYLKDVLHRISPYRVFRNVDNELCLLYWISVNGHDYPGFMKLTTFEGCVVSEEGRPPLKDESIFPNDVSKFVNGRDYRAGNELFEALLRSPDGKPAENDLVFQNILDGDCESYEQVEVDGKLAYRITYKLYKERDIIDAIIDCSPRILVLPEVPASRLYLNMALMNRHLEYIIHFDEINAQTMKKKDEE